MSIDKEIMEYEVRFRSFIKQIIGVSRMKPKRKYLYPLMDGVAFKDLETAILMTNIDYNKVTNDNKKKKI